jgi:hypothetical protein
VVSDLELARLREKIRKVLDLYYPRHQNTFDNTNWEIMHGIVAYGTDTQVFRGGPGGEKVNAIGWLCYNGPCKGEQMLYVDRGKLVARKGVGVQGHYGQFLAILAQSRVKPDYPMQVGGKSFTIADLIEHEKEDCSSGDELTFKLIALSYYLDSDATWSASDGQKWSIERLLQEELKQPIRGAACGGSHRLMGYSYAVQRRIKQGKPITGEFLRAQTFLYDYQRYTAGLQNADGSFSTEWFVRRGDRPDIDRRLQTTGHIAEWLCYSVSNEDLRHPKMVRAVDYLAGILLAEPNRNWSIGPLGHGLHALAIYESRVARLLDSSPAPAVPENTLSTADARTPSRVAAVAAPTEAPAATNGAAAREHAEFDLGSERRGEDSSGEPIF